MTAERIMGNRVSDTTLNIAAGETNSTGTVTITTVDNSSDDPNKTIVVSGAITSGPEDPEPPVPVSLTIIDDEGTPTVSLSPDRYSIRDSTGNNYDQGQGAEIYAILDRPASADVKVN